MLKFIHLFMLALKTSMLAFKREVFLCFEDILYLMASPQYHELLLGNLLLSYNTVHLFIFTRYFTSLESTE